MTEPAPTTNNLSPHAGNVRFGTFDVDLRSGEVRKNGTKIKLYGQPFSVLATLLERPGQVVTREELQQKLWVDDIFVDFEQGLNKAINKVREALGDNAGNPAIENRNAFISKTAKRDRLAGNTASPKRKRRCRDGVSE
jgi:DNA-binding response OmpR family regulator